jgi:hypothetical protein
MAHHLAVLVAPLLLALTAQLPFIAAGGKARASN